MVVLGYIILATLLVSAFSLVGIFSLYFNEKILNKILLGLVAFSTGTLLGTAFLHLLPEALEVLDSETVFLIFLSSFIFFFIVEKVLHWRHCHDGNCDVHSFGYMNLFGDSVHNFIDGLIIAASFIISIPLGVLTTIGIAFHEIPQEIGDFGVLIYAGFEKKKALLFNFLVAVSAVLGGVIGYVFITQLVDITAYLLPFAAGGFTYISTSDLIPELRKETSLKKSVMSILLFILGIGFMWVFSNFSH